jgi:Family of unknown function (DUF5681)
MDAEKPSSANSGKNSGRRGRIENLKPWPKGVSGNLSGRPKSKRLSDAYRRQLEQLVPGDAEGRTWAELIAQAQIRSAARGNVQAARELTDRTEGKASQHVEITGNDRGPVDVASARAKLFEKLGC